MYRGETDTYSVIPGEIDDGVAPFTELPPSKPYQ